MNKKQVIVINSPNSLVTDADVRIMVSACNILMKQVVTHWSPGRDVNIVFRPDMVASGGVQSKKSPTSSLPSEDAQRFFIVNEHRGIPGAIAMYDEPGFRSKENPKGWNPSGFVFTMSILNNNGVALCDNANPNRPTIAAELFKSIAESIVNPFRNVWWIDPICGEFIAAKICDPVEATPLIITLTFTPNVAPEPKPEPKPEPESEKAVDVTPLVKQKDEQTATALRTDIQAAIARSDDAADDPIQHSDDGRSNDMPALVDVAPAPVPEPIKFNVALCNFILPAWSDPDAPDGSRFDFSGTLKSPFQVGIGGCCSKYDSQLSVTPRIIFDRQMPGWKRELAKLTYVSFNTFHAP